MADVKVEIAKLAAETVPWYKDAGRRRLYGLVFVAILSSATNGYDGYGCLPCSERHTTDGSQFPHERPPSIAVLQGL